MAVDTKNSPDVRIDRATEEDLPALSALARTIWHQHYPGIISTEQIDYMLARGYSVDVMRREIEEDGIAYAVLRVDGEMLGYAAFGPEPGGVTKLHKIYLHAAARGTGLGRRLLEHAVCSAAWAGSSAIVLNVNKYNRDAIAFYARNGFVTREAVVVDIGGGFVMDDFVMERRLDVADIPRD
ncbi:MAG: N-acetyltransferase family protein [Capsulimonadaceae bacterium]